MKKRILFLILGISIALILSVFCFLMIRRDVAFRIFQRIRLTFSNADVVIADIETKKSSLSDFEITSTLMLINEEHPIPENTSVFLTKIDSHFMASKLETPYKALCHSIKEKYGDALKIRSSYRTKEEQEEIYGTLSNTVAAKVNASEHQIGMALDVYIDGTVGGAILTTEAGRYLHSHAHEFGFVIRYPYGKSDITGITYEPWHIRYVGKPHAEIMYRESLTLEEYILDFLEPNVYYQIDSYYISRQIPENNEIDLPDTYTSIEIAYDNCGGYIVTAYSDLNA